MKTCNTYYDKIIFYDELDETEQKKIKEHIGSCEQCHAEWFKIRAVETGLEQLLNSNHIGDALLSRYSVYLADPKAPDYDGKRLTKTEINLIRAHTDSCVLCQNKLTQLGKEYQEAATYFAGTDLPDLSLKQPVVSVVQHKITEALKSLNRNLENFISVLNKYISVPTPKVVPVTIGALAALIAITWFGPFLRSDNPYFYLTNVETDRVALLTRGEASERLGKSLDAFKEGDYQSSINFLENFITDEKSEQLKASAHYLLGMSYLIEARTDVLGRFENIDPELVKKAIVNLQIAKNVSNNKATMEECDWYIAKAYLLQGKVENAKQVLERLQHSQGRRFFDARELIQIIDKITVVK